MAVHLESGSKPLAYPDLPQPLGKVVAEYRIAAAGAIAIPETLMFYLLPQIATSKAPHRLEGLQRNCAAPARIDGISVLIWRHQLLGQPAFELHTAVKDVEVVQAKVLNCLIFSG